jgi:hypothetical protein
MGILAVLISPECEKKRGIEEVLAEGGWSSVNSSGKNNVPFKKDTISETTKNT